MFAAREQKLGASLEEKRLTVGRDLFAGHRRLNQLPRSGEVSLLDECGHDKADRIHPAELEAVQIDHAECDLGVGDGVGERPAVERYERAIAGHDEEVTHEPSLLRVVQRLAEESICIVEVLGADQCEHGVNECGVEMLFQQRVAGQSALGEIDRLGPPTPRSGCLRGEVRQ